MYKKPTFWQRKIARDWGWDKETAKRGYAIFDYDGADIFEIERIDEIYCNTDVTDEDCARHAEKSGFCKIIPVEELPENFEYRYFGWIDTPENRENIKEYCRELDECFDDEY